jgi:hypothetical protein
VVVSSGIMTVLSLRVLKSKLFICSLFNDAFSATKTI